MVPTSLTTVQPARAANNKPETSILNAVESCGGYSGALVTFQCMVQRVYCKKAKLARDNRKNYRYGMLQKHKHKHVQVKGMTLQNFSFPNKS